VQSAAHIRRHREGEVEQSEEIVALHDRLQALAEAHYELKDGQQAKQREAFEAEVRALVEQIFALKLEERTQRLEEMKERIARVEAELAKQQQDQDAAIERHLERALRELERKHTSDE